MLFIFLSLGVACKIEGIRGGFVSLSLSRREEDRKEEEGFLIVRSSVGLLRFLLPRKRRLKEKH